MARALAFPTLVVACAGEFTSAEVVGTVEGSLPLASSYSIRLLKVQVGSHVAGLNLGRLGSREIRKRVTFQKARKGRSADDVPERLTSCQVYVHFGDRCLSTVFVDADKDLERQRWESL